MLSFQPHSLFVRDRVGSADVAESSMDHLRGEIQFLRESREYRTAIEKELEVWVDWLTESPSVDKKTLRRAVRQVAGVTFLILLILTTLVPRSLRVSI
jgi:hypothetical protein